MAKQTINIGTGPNTGTGEPLRSALNKANQNFTELYDNQFSGSYNDLTDKPTIPSDLSDLTDTNNIIQVVPHLHITNDPVIVPAVTYGEEVIFTHTDYGDEVDEIAPGLTITRGVQRGLYNVASEQEYDYTNRTSPAGTKWNAEGWDNIENLIDRGYTTWNAAINENPPEAVSNQTEFIMHDTINNEYYAIKFLSWTQGGQGGGFSYSRRKLTIPFRFIKTNYGDEVDYIDEGLSLTRGNQGSLYNPVAGDTGPSSNRPTNTLWNDGGWGDLNSIPTRTYLPFQQAFGNYLRNLPERKVVMKDTLNNEYYLIKFLSWTPGGAGGGFSYVRYKIDQSQLPEGLLFSDGTTQRTAYDPSKPVSTHVDEFSGNTWRIETWNDGSSVILTEGERFTYNTTTNTSTTYWDIFVDRSSNPDIEAAIAAGNSDWEVTLNGVTYTTYGYLSGSNIVFYNVASQMITYTEGDAVEASYTVGGDPVMWWSVDKAPSGAKDFRGAIVNYHAYVENYGGTIVGQINFARDSATRTLSHSESYSGSYNVQTVQPWINVSSDNQALFVRRTDLYPCKVSFHWTSTLFYGPDYWD